MKGGNDNEMIHRRVLQTWWYTMDSVESDLWNHSDRTLRLKFRRLLFAAVMKRATEGHEVYRRIIIYDNEETLVAQRTTTGT